MLSTNKIVDPKVLVDEQQQTQDVAHGQLPAVLGV